MPFVASVDHLLGAIGGGLNGGMLLDGNTIDDNAAVDALLGNGDTDWFIRHLGEISGDARAEIECGVGAAGKRYE